MAKVDYVKINNTINYIQNVAYLSELPVANENSADFVSVNNELYVKQVNGATYTYAKVGGSGGLIVLEKTLVGDFEIGATGLRFTEDFSQEEFDLLYNFQAIIKLDIDNGNGVSSLYLVPGESGKGEGNATVNCILNYGGMATISVSLLIFQGALTYDISIIPIESGGSGGTEVIEKTIDTNGGEPLVFTEDFTQEEFDKLLNGSALLQIWTMPNVLSYILKPYAIQKKEDMNAYAIRLSCLTDIESGNHLYMLLIKRDGVITYQIENVSSGGASEPTVVNLNTYVPSTATNGTLDSSVLQTLQASDSNYIVFNNEIFKLADKQHNEGYLVYSHNGHDTTGCFFQKCITITISTRGWVLEEQENASKTYVSEQITSAYGFDVSVNGQTLVFSTIGDALQGDY